MRPMAHSPSSARSAQVQSGKLTASIRVDRSPSDAHRRTTATGLGLAALSSFKQPHAASCT
eukprot:14515813-Alexandrium_andersonii.AAC.1